MLSTWIWRTNDIITHQSDILNNLYSRGVKEVYLQWSDDILYERYRNFISHAHKYGIKVYALNGDPSWVKTQEYIPWLNSLMNYQMKSKTYEQFIGVHIDVEPYLLPEWGPELVGKYQEMIRFILQHSHINDYRFGIDIPFWFNTISVGDGLLSEWVIDRTDETCLMAYRSAASGPNGVIELCRDEMEYANKNNRKIRIAVETLPIETALSFHDFGEKYMLETLDIVRKEYCYSRAFSGFAIHDYHSWIILKN